MDDGWIFYRYVTAFYLNVYFADINAPDLIEKENHMAILEHLMNIFRKQFIFYVEPESITVRNKDKNMVFRAYIDLSTDPERQEIVSVGGDPMPNAGGSYIRVNLFQLPDGETYKSDRKPLLEVFFRHILRELHDRRTIIRPKIVFRNTSSICHLLSGYQEFILRSCAEDAGVSECIFVD